MLGSTSARWSRARKVAVIGAAVVVMSVAISAVAFATLAGGSTVTLCVNAQHTARVLGGSSSCKSGEQAVKIYTKAGADARFALKTHAHTLTAYESETSCTHGVNGSGEGEVDAYSCDLFNNSGLTGSPNGKSYSTFIQADPNPNLNEATLTLHLAKGDINAMGFYDAGGTSHLSIAGGTGIYAKATGTVNGAFMNVNVFVWTVHYSR
jgi:hypothetical protein